jgi:error-prone DNA polymerase
MAEGRLQCEGEVIHVMVSCCYNFSKLLRHLTASRDERLPLLTLSRADEKSLPPAKIKKASMATNSAYSSRVHFKRKVCVVAFEVNDFLYAGKFYSGASE